jgi:tRNA(fMet)-specific endonuclease VapC
MDEVLLDTDILSEVLKGRDQQVLSVAGRYLAEHERFAFSAITLYEILRGLRANRAHRALREFLERADSSEVLPVSMPVLVRASDLWADARQGGHPQNDADLIIAATALEAGRVLVTGNARHFAWISGLSLADWRSVGP